MGTFTQKKRQTKQVAAIVLDHKDALCSDFLISAI